MKKRIGIIMLSMLLVLGLVGCGNSVAKDAIKQGKEALQKKEYSKAVALFNIVLDNDVKNQEAVVLKNIINDYLTGKEYFQQGKIEEAQKTFQGIDPQYSEYSIKDDINSVKKQIEEHKKTNEAINNDISKLITLYDDKKYDDAKKIISELNKKNAEKENNKQAYIEKLNNIEAGMKDLEEMYDSGVTSAMMQAGTEEYERWDKALNEIYEVLKIQLSASDMSKLKEEQIQWISDKEKRAEDDESEVKGGSMASLMHISSLATTTKDRCYELVEEYMK